MALLDFLNPIKPLIDAAERAYSRKLAAENDKDRIEADKEIAFWNGRIELAQVAAQHDKWWSPRTLMGWCVAIYIFRIVVWDTVLGLGVTEYPGEHVTYVVMTVVAFYFVSRGAEVIAGSIASSIARRGSK